MARITVEECRRTVPNPFELVLLAAERARSLKVGAKPLIERGRRDAPHVIALREIGLGCLSPDELREAALRRRSAVALDRDTEANDDFSLYHSLVPDTVAPAEVGDTAAVDIDETEPANEEDEFERFVEQEMGRPT